MSAVNITNVAVLDNPAPFLSPFQFEISYECLDALKDGKFFILLSFYFLFDVKIVCFWGKIKQIVCSSSGDIAVNAFLLSFRSRNSELRFLNFVL